MKKVLAFLASLALVAQVQPAYAADAYNPDAVVGVPNTSVFSISDEGTLFRESTLGSSGKNSAGQDEAWVCDGADDFDCFDSKTQNAIAMALLPVCQSAADMGCIAKLELAGADGIFHEGKYLRNIGGTKFPEVKNIGFPGATTTSLWDVPEVPSASGTTTYSVNALTRIAYNSYVKGRWVWETLSGAVFPYREITGDYKDLEQFTSESNHAGIRGIAGNNKRGECIWNENGKCGIAQDFAQDTRVRLTLRISKDISGWFRGRLKDPKISVASVSAKDNEVVVDASPVAVSRMQLIKNNKDLTPYQSGVFKRWGGGGNGGNRMSFLSPERPETFEYLENMRADLDDTASGTNTFWGFSTIQTVSGTKCLQDKSRLLGIVSTNAMVYDGDTPVFKNGFLSYKVAGLHYQASGQDLSLGSYDLVMRSDVARCLYGFSKAPLSATVSVVNEKGTKTTATTVVSEKNGWLKMAAYGFTFSKKTIKVKITKKKN
jgi:hypothetical protein